MKDLETLGIHILSMDVTEEKSMTAGIEKIIEEEGRLDILVNNAGFGSYGAVEEVPLEAMSDALRNEVRQFGIDVVVIEPGGIQSEWADIAVDNGLRNSGNGVYKTMTGKFAALQKSFGPKTSDPMVIARIVLKAIKARMPRTRYAAGFMATPVLTMRKFLPDRLLDKLLLSQLQ